MLDGELLQQEGREARACSATEGVEDQEPLESYALFLEFPDAVEDDLQLFLALGRERWR